MIICELNEVHCLVGRGRRARSILYVEHLRLRQGEILGVIGPNGAGKSTLLKTMALLEPPSSGTLLYRGQPVDPARVPASLRRRMSTVFQNPLLLDMSVFDNVAIGLSFRGVPRKERSKRVNEWLERFRVRHLARQRARTLSGGEAQRVSLARALVLQPEVLFMDEPFSALDFPTKAALMEDLKAVLRESGTTAVLVTHDFLEATFMADRLAVLVGGELVQEGPVPEVIARPTERAAPFVNGWKSMATQAISQPKTGASPHVFPEDDHLEAARSPRTGA
ncbi:MAG: ATP-binding cassette domain-containing protein [Firmicutes bacterium]|nr:ATP-binding cassette domain-containing protein [Bacillota bacterium]